MPEPEFAPTPGLAALFGHTEGEPLRPLVDQPNMTTIDRATLITPGDTFAVFDPGTAPQDVFLQRRTPEFAPLTPPVLPQLEPEPVPEPIQTNEEMHASTLPLDRSAHSGLETPAKFEKLRELPGGSRLLPNGSVPAQMPGDSDAAARMLKHRPTPQGDSVGIAIFCVLFFVVSCAGTVIFGPRVLAVVTTLFHH
jgi:hypothetical protein